MDTIEVACVTGDAAPQEAHVRMLRGEAVLVDVRGFDEFAAGHAPLAKCIPLADLERRAGEIATDRDALMICRSGNRGSMAAERLRALGMTNIVNVRGGMLAWEAAGLPVEKQQAAMPLERQVRIAAGTLVLGFSLLGFFVNAAFFYGSAFVGFMLAFTGVLGICPMMSILRLMPWNRVSSASACAK